MTGNWSVTGVVERGGIPVPERPDVAPPAGWRLEAVWAVDRPRHPDVHGERVALIVDRDSSDVWVLDPQLRRLTTDRPLAPYWEDTGPRWSPDGSRLAYVHDGAVWLLTTEGQTERLCQASAPVWLDDATLVVEAERNDRTVLAMVGADDGWLRPLPDLAGDLGEVAVAPDRRRLAAVRSPRDDLNASRIVVIDTADGTVTELDGPAGIHDRNPVWSPDGTSLCFASEASGWYEVERWDLASGAREPVTADSADFGELAWSTAGLAAVRTRHGVSDLVLLDPTGWPGPVTVMATGGMWSSPCFTAAGALVACHEAPDTPPRLVRLEPSPTLRQPSLVTLSPPPPAPVASAHHVVPDHVWYPGPNGDVPAFLFRPPTASSERPCPAVVYPHGGPTSHYGAEWDGVAQYFLAKGYAWLAPNFVGSTSYGRNHERANHGVWGVADTAECLAAHQWLADLDWVDGDRIAIFGASYGSYLALASVVDGDRFACAVAEYGDCDILTSWAQGDRVGRLDLERMMGHPSTTLDVYHRGSPIHRIEAISAPILVAHGERDERVHPAQSEELVDALRRIGASYEYVTYPTEAHGFLSREPFLDFYRRLERFLDWYLMPPPAAGTDRPPPTGGPG